MKRYGLMAWRDENEIITTLAFSLYREDPSLIIRGFAYRYRRIELTQIMVDVPWCASSRFQRDG